MRHVAVLALLLVPALALAQGQEPLWTQMGGGPSHSRLFPLGDRPLDVVASYGFKAVEGERIDSGGSEMVLTPHGPMGVIHTPLAAGTGAICQLFRISDVVGGAVERIGAPVACDNGGKMLAYDAANDQVLVAIDGLATDPLLQAWSARTGEPRWRLAPQVIAEAPGAADYNDWYIDAIAFDDASGIAYVGFASDEAGRHRVAAVEVAAGRYLWSTAIPASAFADTSGLPQVAPLDDPTLAQAAQMMEVYGITLTESGLVVSGGYSLSATPAEGVAAAWLDPDGEVVGAFAAPPPAPSSAGFATVAAATGPRAALPVLDQVLLVDPANQEPLLAPLPGASGVGLLAAPAWSREALVVPRSTTIVIFPAGDVTQPRHWPGWDNSLVLDVIVSPPGDLYALVWRATADGSATELVRIDLAAARTLDVLPLPFAPEDVDAGWAYLLPLGDGRLLAWSELGAAVLLAPGDERLRPSVVLDNEYPPAGQALTLRADAPPEARRLTVAWGDGVLDTIEPGAEASHKYDVPGRRVVRVIAQYPDGRTGTTEATVYVGTLPPQQLNAIQRAFSSEYQEWTFFVLGLVATGLGTLYALRQRLRRKSRLQTDLERLDALRALGKRDAYEAVRQLARYRHEIKRDLARGALDDAQFTALATEAVRLLSALRLRLVGDLEGRLSARFRHLLEGALEDGAVTADEAAALSRALAEERALAPEERERLARLIAGWQEPEASA